MKAFSFVFALLVACSLSLAETSQPFPELIVDVGNASLGVYPPSGDSVIVCVYMENVLEPVGGFDMWLSLGHEEIFIWDTVRIPGTAIENWEIAVTLDSGELHIIGNGSIEDGVPPIQIGQHLLMVLMAEVRADRLDPDGTVVDSMCDSPYYELYGVTPVHIDSAQFWTEDSTEINGCDWELCCIDSVCTECVGDSCLAWQCIEWDWMYVCDTTAVQLLDGEIALDCDQSVTPCGDYWASGMTSIDDVVFIVAFIFQGGPSFDPPEAGDVDCSRQTDIDDVIYLIEYIFGGGPAPCDPDGDGVPDC